MRALCKSMTALLCLKALFTDGYCGLLVALVDPARRLRVKYVQ